jgi:hypothetical protein
MKITLPLIHPVSVYEKGSENILIKEEKFV